MNPESMFIAAFLAGLFGSIHCLGMCGGISSALGVSIKSQHKSLMAIVFQLGRLTSYTLMGTLLGLLGANLSEMSGSNLVAITIRLVSVLFMFLLGLYLAGWLPSFAKIEKVGLPIWRKLSPITKRFLPVTTAPQGFGLGFLWGWLPCGLVYSVLIWSATLMHPLESGLLMFSFGLGTLPAMFALSLGGSQLMAILTQKPLRRLIGISVSLMALVVLALQLGQIKPL